ncbi:transposase [Deinococcus peraridilitoris]|uniref:transposase n=1 Tax=Deinococcus peraridilitoris TaxID=432329 RepID=UPI0012FAC0B2|nr:transposase [Deinococcus peraridilitoris]
MVRQTQVGTGTAKTIGVDDFAFRRGHIYDTIIVDLDTHQPIDVLPDRLAETLATWLRTHPEVETVVRDCSTDYAAGINEGCPAAQQVLDRPTGRAKPTLRLACPQEPSEALPFSFQGRSSHAKRRGSLA